MTVVSLISFVLIAASGAAADAHPTAVAHRAPSCGPHVSVLTPTSPDGAMAASDAGMPKGAALFAKAAAHHATWRSALQCTAMRSRHERAAAPSATKYSLNWSGYIAAATAPTYAQAEWGVPAVTSTGSGPAYSSIWPGIGGAGGTSGTLIQAGTEQDVTGGSQSTFFWIEVVPNDPYELRISNLVPAVGDDVAAAVSWNNGTAYFTLCDYTQQSCVTAQQTGVAAPGNSAEWVVERPTLGSGAVADLAGFGTVSLSNAYYGAGGTYYAASAGGEATVMLNSSGNALAYPGAFTPAGAGFTDYWLSYN
ncbi:G1 family glutamic endopeptidase [Sinomonas sp. ASV322]|uniref:G1 family glutamic endopeptidase n=1 Tax=Sinomonas sp. ASV322 TaxID=3041920 RepID=UPI0027DC86C0|nr:G1 family glutamic endopeptidase [Sinomonas sp. ASV322]MDQ4500856.1 hypothetical protein [Sinomonas sp. ASV322]